MEDLSGKHIRGYDLGERIGEGGFGVVYRAHQSVIKRDVVIKAILPTYANNPDFIRNFEAEAQLIARLEHIHIVPLYDYWRGPEGAFLVMRWLRGGSLLDSLSKGPWELQSVIRLLDQIASALTLAHRSSVIHQDIKPANILLDDEGNAYLTDFGLAKDLTGDLDLAVSTLNASVRGSPAYISPEQIKRTAISAQTDIYSLGIVLYELLSGVHPFGITNIVELLRHQLNSQLPAIQTHRPDLPDKLNLVLWRATAKDPDVRYRSVIEMAEAFHEAVADYDLLGAPPKADGTRTHVPLTSTTGVISLSSLDALLTGPANPYKGLRAFQEADAADFFGRETLVERLLERLSQTGESSRFLAVVGPSGSGKSSVVKAGLMPALRRGRLKPWHRWYIVEMTPGAQPVVELANVISKIATTPEETITQLLAEENGLHRAIVAALPAGDMELVLVIDQFEEVFTLVSDEKLRSHFLRIICHAVTAPDSRLRLIATLRADFYDKPLSYTGIGELLRQRTEVVLPMSAAELEIAIAAPAERVGLEFEPGLVERIVADVIEQPNALPLLQFTLSELYEHRKKDRLGFEAYSAVGGISGALVRRADELYQQMNPQQREILPQIFLRLITLGEGTEDTRRRALQSELLTLSDNENLVSAAVEQFGKYRLLTFDRDPATRAPTVEIAHEALIRTWQTLREWLDRNRSDLRIQRQLSAAATEWNRSNRDTSFLASGARLAQFQALQQSAVLALNETEQAYLQASVRRYLRETRLKNIILSAAVIGALVMVFLALIAIDQRNQAANASRLAVVAQSTAVAERDRADREAMIARSRELAASALSLSDQIDVALLLSLTALDTADTFEARDGLLSLLQANPRLIRTQTGHSDWIRSVASSTDGKWLASGSRDGSVRLWLLSDPAKNIVLQGHNAWVNTVAFSPDNGWLASGDNSGGIIIWDLQTTPPQAQPLEGHQDAVWSLAFSADGQRLASGGADNQVRLWDTTSGNLIAARSGHQDIVYAVAYHPNNNVLASGSADNTIRLWDSHTLEPVDVLTGHANWVFDVDFSPDGQFLVSGSADNTLRIWNLSSGENQMLRGHTNWVRSVKFLPDSQGIVSGGADGLILIWNRQTSAPVNGFPTIGYQAVWSLDIFQTEDSLQIVSGGTDPHLYLWNPNPVLALGNVIEVQEEQINAAAINPQGTLLATGGGLRDGFAVSLRNLDGSSRTILLEAHQDQVTSLAFHPDQPWLASASLDHTVKIWNTQTGEVIQTLTLPDSVFAIAFRPDGQQLAVGDNTSMVTLWNLAEATNTWQPFNTPLRGHQDRVVSLDYHPASILLASGSRDSTIRLWDTDTGSQVGEPLNAHADGVLGLAFSPDGRALASSGRDAAVRLWTNQTGEWEPDGNPLLGHTNWVTAVEFSPDGTLLASASGDQSVILWHLQQRAALGRGFQGHTDWVNAIAFDPSGAELFSGGRDGQVISWATGLDSWRRQACQIANRTFTIAEQNRYLHSQTAGQAACAWLNEEQTG